MFARVSPGTIFSQNITLLPKESVEQKDFRGQFPIFAANQSVVYFDSAATAQKPRAVLQAERDYAESVCANSGRGSYRWAYQTSRLIAGIRAQVASFINCSSPDEVAFTSGATMSLNLVALAWGEENLEDGDQILYCPSDHKSLNEPWFNLQRKLARRKIDIELVPYPLLSSGAIDISALSKVVSDKTRLINITHANNVAGVVNDVLSIRKVLPAEVLINLDCAQTAGHLPIDVQDLNVDFVSFSGHKIYSTTGIGVLWVRKNLHAQLVPVIVGGGQSELSQNGSTKCAQALAELIESGTQNISGIISLGAALEFINAVGRERLHEHTSVLTDYLRARLAAMPQIELVYADAKLSKQSPTVKCGLVSFNVAGFSSTEVGDYLASCNMFVRHGTHCTGNGAANLGAAEDSVRVSFGIYNTVSEIDKLLAALNAMPSDRSNELSHFC